MKKFSQEHEWVEVDGENGVVGISEYAIEQLGDITFLELPEVDEEVSAEDSVAFIESVKAASDIYTPVSGTITEVNEALLDTPELLNQAANVNWIYKMTISDESELENLMDETSYNEYTESL
ncbi:glycine cleavage system protein GcvH [Halarcobacter sp.]|uniref:glycine cleavage system protein GcvH n=1 Tax=Halarcobacter sp. TaxID=2321133 RepID=UPI002AAB9561|nr:glycine cleavage system protein GcvH [Halarcobacter sp.]